MCVSANYPRLTLLADWLVAELIQCQGRRKEGSLQEDRLEDRPPVPKQPWPCLLGELMSPSLGLFPNSFKNPMIISISIHRREEILKPKLDSLELWKYGH